MSANERIVFDVGLPLDALDKNLDIKNYQPDIQGLFDEKMAVSAVFLSHAHPDHYGLLSRINKDIPVYMSKAAAIILKEIMPLFKKETYENLIIKEIADGEEIKIGSFIIKAHAVDHSATGAMAFEILAENKKILYSGDIRFHGRRVWQSQKFVKTLTQPDYLLLEGTTLGRKKQEQQTEEDIENRLIELFAQSKLSLIAFSSQNIDRLVSVYKACLRNNRILVLDPYTCFILDKFQAISTHLPQFDWRNIRVYFAVNSFTKDLAKNGTLYKYKKAKIRFDELLESPEKYVVKANFVITKKLIDKIGAEKMQLIYSLWKGYLDKAIYWSDYKDDVIYVHTSGHAYTKDLQKFVETVHPQNIIPIHTECKNIYAELFAVNVIPLNDNEGIEL